MSELTDCLHTAEPKVLNFPEGVTHPLDPVSWALEMFATNLPEADMQIRESPSGNQDSKLTYFDGFLLHMSGQKRVRVWPVPNKYRQRVIFNHRDFKGRMATKPIDFELKPGQILYIPSGAMHEVIAHGEETAVSVSFHLGSPFPMLTLCTQLNMMVQGGKVSVPPYMKKIDKFNLFFFEPTRFIEKDRSPDDGMPDRLLKELSGVLQSMQVDVKTMRRMLSNWWRLAMSRPMYQGPYPERVGKLSVSV